MTDRESLLAAVLDRPADDTAQPRCLAWRRPLSRFSFRESGRVGEPGVNVPARRPPVNPDPTRSHADPDTPTADPSLDAGLAAAFGSGDTPGPPGQPPATEATPGTGPRYALGDEIARGGMGVVYRATDT